MDCYIYFKSEAQHSAQVIAAERELQALLFAQCRIRAQLQRRPESHAGLLTWMEIYHAIPEDFSEQLQHALSQTALPQWQRGERHAEYFMDVEVCV